MSKKRLYVDWTSITQEDDYSPALKRFGNYLKDKGFRKSTIGPYEGCVKRYLKFAKTDSPSA